MSNLWEPNREPVNVLALLDVAQVDVLEDYQLLIVLSGMEPCKSHGRETKCAICAERQVITFPLDALDPMDPMAGLKRAKRIASHISFFKAGICLGKTLVCVVKASALSSTIKALEPIDTTVRGARKPTFKKLLQGGNDTLKLFKVTPSSVLLRILLNCSVSRSSISLSTQVPSISSAQNSALAVPTASRSSTWILWIPRGLLTPQTCHWILCANEKVCDLSPSTGLTTNFSYVTTVSSIRFINICYPRN